uniref:TBC1 domain family, member 12b n=1 Tax=Eptatretus burgeri TaxID=7764 RepID=A0A8C4WSY8_EPTBU
MIPATALRASKASTFPRGAYDSGSLPLHFGKSRHGAETLVTDPSSASRSSLSSLDSELSATLESTSCGAAGLGECDDNGELCTRPGSCGDLAGAMPWLDDIKELTLNNPEEGEPRELSMQEIEVAHGAEDKRKRSGFASFIARNWLALRGKDLRSAGSSTLGWKLFGKIPLKESPRKDPKKIQQEYEAKMGRGTSQAALTLPVARRDNKFEPLSTTALILEQRPLSLPAKSEEEMQHHQELYNEMVARARKREVRDAQRQKRLLKERCKKEESIIQAGSIWTTEILPNWEHSCGTRKVRELWWQGLPPSIRGKVWSLAIGNELNITPELYEIFLSRAKEKWRSYSESSLESQNGELGANGADRESSLELITLDISRTFPSLCIFQKGGPYHSTLQNVLGAYTCYRPDIGYVQGMSFLAAVLLLNLDVEEAFITFANLLNKPCQLVFFRVDHSLMLTYFETFELFFEENLPQLFRHFNSSNLTPDLYLIDW